MKQHKLLQFSYTVVLTEYYFLEHWYLNLDANHVIHIFVELSMINIINDIPEN